MGQAAKRLVAGQTWIRESFPTLATKAEQLFRSHPYNSCSLVSDKIKVLAEEEMDLDWIAAVDTNSDHPFGPASRSAEDTPSPNASGCAFADTRRPSIKEQTETAAGRFVLVHDPSYPA